MKIGIVGSGMVGATAAYAMVMRGVGREIVLVDKNQARAEAEADDIYHAVPFASALEINDGDYSDLKGCKVVIIAAGVNQASKDETRLQLLGRNAQIFRQIVPEILKYAPEAILVVATNPVDIMTHITAQFAAEHGVPSTRVFGSGTTLDTARFRTLVGRHVGVDSHHVHGYVIGEHGDSEVLTWSLVDIAGISLDEFCRRRNIKMDFTDRARIDENVRNAAYHIIQGKGATYYGIGSALTRIVEVILHDQRAIMTVCAPHNEIADVKNVTVAMPHLIGGNGIIDTFPLKLSYDEQEKLHKSANLIRGILDDLEKEVEKAE
ncbi:MAG: L-lactate dehydrogenase [Phototrophicales bacterium]|nr:MAG: L-lactate dehydrogenase [Phototrophicales bacterium]RMG75510.1 MAG: L-lactate dehydrogenase [Chloroflexota bacterium]